MKSLLSRKRIANIFLTFSVAVSLWLFQKNKDQEKDPGSGQIVPIETSSNQKRGASLSRKLKAPQEKKRLSSLSLPEMKKLLEKTYSELPKQKDLSKLDSSKVHHIPAELLEYGHHLGELKEALVKNKSFHPQAYSFYHKCTFDKRKLKALRALCMVNLEIFSTFTKNEFKRSEMPKEIFSLAEELLPSRAEEQ